MAASRRLVLRKKAPQAPPTAAQLDRERTLWGPHPDKAQAAVEDLFWRPGFEFLAALYGAAFGVAAPRKLQKALGDGPQPHGWGQVAELYKRPSVSPLELRDGWGRLIDHLVNQLFNTSTREELANAVAIKAHWLGRIRSLTEAGAGQVPGTWQAAMGQIHRREEVQAMEWTKAKALQGVSGLASGAKEGLLNTLIQSRQEGLPVRALMQRCYDRFADQNRDWRRLALTETAAAVTNGQLAAIDPDEGWEAVWVSAARGCPWCVQWDRQVFQVVAPDAPVKDGQRQLWAGKTNIGRRGAAKSREGQPYPKADQWWPCIPCHPNCGCSLVTRRVSIRRAA